MARAGVSPAPTRRASPLPRLRGERRRAGEPHHVDLAGVFLRIGFLPNTERLNGPMEPSRLGQILIDGQCASRRPGAFAAGDAPTMPYKQIVIAAGEGSKAAQSAFDHLIRQG